jgi:phosphatidylserine decarboxylase
MIYDRATKQLVEDLTFGQAQTTFLYTTIPGRLLLKMVSSRFFSRLIATYYNSKLSVKKIIPFKKTYDIDSREFMKKTFDSFNDFFTRQLKPEMRPFSKKSTDFISPADAKLTHKHISSGLVITVKGGFYSIADIVNDEQIAQDYIDGDCFIFRLSMDDCHRYTFIDDGTLSWTKSIKGKLHTVQPIAHKTYRSYIRNQRIVSQLRTKHFGDIIVIEIGALLVGKIKNHQKKSFKRGEEKGYFELGGSTIIVLVKPGVVNTADDIARLCANNVEVRVRMGETIGSVNV